jgi:phosphatidate cytidylyltransferase
MMWGAVALGALVLALVTNVRRKQKKPAGPMWLQYIAWAAAIAAITVPVILGRLWVQVALLIVSLVAFEEFSRAVGLWKERSQVWLARACIVLLYVPVCIDWHSFFMAMPAYVILLIFVFPVIKDRYKGMVQRSCLTILGVIYFGWFMAHVAVLMNAPNGAQLMLAFLFIVLLHDAVSYVVGNTFGKRRVSPHVNPDKTVEGVLIALAVTVGLTFLLRFALPDISVAHTLLLGLLLGVGATCGDLTVSLIKRDVQFEDGSPLAPGQGIVLDRLDAVLFTAPIFLHFMNHFYNILGTGG